MKTCEDCVNERLIRYGDFQSFLKSCDCELRCMNRGKVGKCGPMFLMNDEVLV